MGMKRDIREKRTAQWQKLITTLRLAWTCAAEANEEAQQLMKAKYDRLVRPSKLSEPGPACTLPKLPAEEQQLLEQAEAEELVGLPGFSHQKDSSNVKQRSQNLEETPTTPNSTDQTEEPGDEVSIEEERKRLNLRDRSKIQRPKRFDE
ncbi:hypothetical protein GPALN_003313 [Globodera pallida]|nr:hypothetical protein GPALN_003313 [Globodera pallida]